MNANSSNVIDLGLFRMKRSETDLERAKRLVSGLDPKYRAWCMGQDELAAHRGQPYRHRDDLKREYARLLANPPTVDVDSKEFLDYVGYTERLCLRRQVDFPSWAKLVHDFAMGDRAS